MTQRILIIDGHPDPAPGHLVHALADAYGQGADEAGHAVTLVTVAELDFPLLRRAEDFQDGTPPPDLARLEIRGGHRSSSESESGSLDDRFDVDDDHLDYSQSSVSAKSSRTYDPDAR